MGVRVGRGDVMNKFYYFNDKFHAYGKCAIHNTWFSQVNKEL